MEKHLVLAGGGHAHMQTMANFSRFQEKGYRVTLISPAEFHYYSGMGPGLLGGMYSPEMIRFQTRHTVEKQGGSFVPGKVSRIDPREKILTLKSGQTIEYPDIFGGGDCIAFQKRPLNKVGVYAVRQNPVLLHNLQARLEHRPLIPFDPGGDYLLVFNLGDGTGVFHKKGLVFNGRTAFRIKDWIDRRFMNKFQRQG